MKIDITKQDYIDCNQKLKSIFSKYCAENNLFINFYDYENNYKLYKKIPKDISLVCSKSAIINRINAPDFFKNNFDFVDEKGNYVKYTLSINDHEVSCKKIWEYVDLSLNLKEKIIFNKFIFKSYHPERIAQELKTMGDEKFWFAVRHMKQPNKSYSTKTEFNLFFPEIQKKIVDTDEKVVSLYNFLNSSRNFAKEDDKIALVCDFLSKKVDSKHHEIFEKILDKKIESKRNANYPEDIMQEPRISLTLVLNKSDYYEKIPAANLKSIEQLNYFNRSILHALKDDDILKKLNLLDVEHIEFNSTSKTAKFIFEFELENLKSDLPFILLNAIKAASDNYDYKNTVKDVIEKTIDNYLLIKKLESNLLERDPAVSVKPRKKI